MKHPERLQSAARWLYRGCCAAPWAWQQWKRFGPKKKKARKADPPRVYRRFFTRDRSFAELVRPAKK